MKFCAGYIYMTHGNVAEVDFYFISLSLYYSSVIVAETIQLDNHILQLSAQFNYNN